MLIPFIIRFGSLCLLTFSLDRVSKAWIAAHFATGDSICISSWLHFSRVHNSGAAWGMFQNGAIPLSIVAILACVAIFFFRKSLHLDKAIPQILLGGMTGGILGNLFDRLSYGYVLDFIDIYLPFYHWPTFNIADCAIVVGAIGTSLYITQIEKRAFKR